MRIPTPVSLGLIIALGAVSTMLWRQLHTERQLTADLQTQLTEARAALAAKPPPPPAVAVSPPPPAAAPAAPPEKSAVAAASATLLAESAKRQKAMLEDAEFRKARIAQVRSNLQLRFANIARDLGLSQNEADALLTILAESQVREDSTMTDLLASAGANPDPAKLAELSRTEQQLEQKRKDEITALLGPQRAAAYQDYEQTAPSRQRVSNLTNMMTQAGKPMTAEQSKSLTTLIVAEQRRQESEAKTLATSGQSPQQSQAERAIEGDRRVLAAAADFLDAGQIELMRARFEQVAARTRAQASVQQRAVEAAVQGAGN